jgi:hypothetical protein
VVDYASGVGRLVHDIALSAQLAFWNGPSTAAPGSERLSSVAQREFRRTCLEAELRG